MRFLLFSAGLTPLLFLQFGFLSKPGYFEPKHRLSGIGVAREEMSEAVLARRTELMIESQTFTILRDPQALAGAERITSPKLQKIFDDAARRSGLPSSFIAAIAYLESWGNAKSESPTGPKGIMQIAHGTARAMGLKITYATRYKTVVEPRTVKGRKGKPVTRTVRRRIPYTVLVRDERLIPERAVPAAAQYLARLERRFGGRDWAVWAYHCGEGCTSEVKAIAARAAGISEPITVPKVFFGAHPAFNRELYDALREHMDRDYSPTYWFRIKRAEQLLALYRQDRAAFRKLFLAYRNRVNPEQRAPHRLAVWLTPDDIAYRDCEDLKREQGRSLVRILDAPAFFGFTIRSGGSAGIGSHDPANREYYLQASPAAVGTLAYIAWETRRLHEKMDRRGEKFVPLEVTALVQPLDYEERTLRRQNGRAEPPTHCTGHVFDIAYGKLPPRQREALEFILNDLGWNGYLGFVKDGGAADPVYHIGSSPTARDFFAQVYQDAVDKLRQSD